MWLGVPCSGLAETILGEGAGAASDDPFNTARMMSVAMGLGLVLLLILAIGWALRHLTRFSSATGDVIKVLGGRSLGPRERLVLLQVGEEQLLLGVAPGRIEKLHVLRSPIPEVTAPEVRSAASLAARWSALASRSPSP